MSTDIFDSKMRPRFAVGQELKVFDKDDSKWVSGIVTEVGEYTLEIKWDDLSDPTDYDLDKVSISGDVFTED